MFYRHHRSSSVSTLIYTHCLGSSLVSPTDASILFSHASATFRHTLVHLGFYFHHYTTPPRTCHLQLRCLGHCDYDYNYRNTVSISAPHGWPGPGWQQKSRSALNGRSPVWIPSTCATRSGEKSRNT